MKKQKKREFDEREISLRTQVHSHGLAILIALVVLDAVLGAAGVNWAAGRTGGLILAAAAFLAVRLEHIFRNISYGRIRSPKRNIIFLLAVVAVLCLTVGTIHALRPPTILISEGQLTHQGCATISLSLVVFSFLCDVGKILYDLRRKDRKIKG